jgi:hypothetical protein
LHASARRIDRACARSRPRSFFRAHFAALAVALSVFVPLSAPNAARAQQEECLQDVDCADGNVCNGIERCVCAGEPCSTHVCATSPPIPCDDGDECTEDACDPAVGCSHAEELCPASCAGQPDGARCIDGSVCTSGDQCQGGVCVPGPAPACPDMDSCTSAACDPVFGCVYTEEFVSAPCVPECTGTVADFTRCPGDSNICSIDACLPSTSFGDDKCIEGLLFGRQCADGDLCNGDEWCSPVLGCQANSPRVCDDGDACNGDETCDALNGCIAGTPLPDGSACDDHLACTGNDSCAAENCSGTPLTPADCDDANPGTADQCREGFGCLGCRPLAIKSLGVKFAADGKPGSLKARGEIVLGAATVAPAAESVTLIADLDGAEAYRATLPAGALVALATGKYSFKDKTGAVNGLRSLRLTERNGALAWKSAAKGLAIAGPQATSAAILLIAGDDCFASNAACTVTGSGKGLKCR